MNEKETLEYNKRCVEFLPFNYRNQSKYWVIYKYDDNSFFGKNRRYLAVNNLKFHSDWNWIMEVVEAIEKLKFRFEIALNEVNFYCISEAEERRFSYAINYHDCENYGEEMHLTKREAVVIAINQFLIWFEQNKNIFD